ncbi:MAG: sodium-independent anion transporter [Syntrophobacteraceae bacterium CG2_30_61_12]|nr:MAG: sodium-independent anion transporter [Syntrophobacteraceae bacterium CG2_30_61_12]
MIAKIFPFILWLRGYRLSDLRIDFLAGITVALVLIPQSMAYAQLAGLPAYYGLYAAFLPPMIAALFGSSRQLATGPVAVVSLMTSASLAPLATTGSAAFIAYAILLAFMVGLFQFGLGLLRLGLVVNFLSHPVVNGFTNAAAIIIASSQLSKMFGVTVDSAEHHYETIVRVVVAASHYIHWPTLAMGLLAFVIMYGLRRISPKIPNVLVAVVVTTVLSWAIGFQQNLEAPLGAIEDQEARRLVTAFNQAVNAVPALAEQRTEAYQAMEAAAKKHDPLAELDARHQVEAIAMQMERLKEEAHIHREALRDIAFRGVAGAEGWLRFYRKDQVPPEAKPDGRIWHLRVGNSPLKPEGLRMMGGGAVIGDIPKGLPAFALPQLEPNVLLRLLPFAAIISLLGFMEAISIAKAMAAKTGQRLDPNQELIGQGLANMVGALGQSYPTSGSFSRSAVNLQAGAVTGLASVFTSLAVVIVLLFFTPLLYHLPQSVLAAIIMMAVVGLLNVAGFVHAWHAQWYDGLISIITFLCTLGFAPHLDRGIMVGVVLSLSVFLYKSMRPKVVTLARADDESLRCADVHGLKECRYLALVRFDGPLFFANASYLEDKITERMQNGKDLKHIVIVSNGINDIDASGEEALSLLIDRVRAAGIDVSLSGVNEAVLRVLLRTHLLQKIGEDHIFPTMEKAIATNYDRTHREGAEEVCPLVRVCRLAEG